MAASSLEREFETRRLQLLGDLPEPFTQYRFAPPRRFRLDFAWPNKNAGGVAVECEGIMSAKSRHTTISGYSKDCEKYNLAIEKGWFVLRYTILHLRNDPGAMFEQIRRVLESC